MVAPPTPTRAARARASLGAFATGQRGYLDDAHPAAALRIPIRQVFDALQARLGPVLAQALDPAAQLPSPRLGQPDGQWLQRSYSVGVNVRTTGDLLGALKFVLTLPPQVDAIHLLPIFEPGVVGSLYGMASWRINAEFRSAQWAEFLPRQRHVDDQLRAFVNLCHALGKTVGLDVIPHVDRFSEIALCNPWLFEWVRRRDATLLDHRAGLHEEVMATICGYRFGRSSPQLVREFFGRPEQAIAFDLFGDGGAWDRDARRDGLVQWLYDFGYETVPATMAPPYRGLALDADEAAVTVDHRGRRWRDYRLTAPTPMSRVFGPLTRYHLWETHDDNAHWQLDHARPRLPVWDYVATHYRDVVARYGFDFMRGDMSHVQTRPTGVPTHDEQPYDLLRYVKRACAKTYPHFAYFAESFLTADDYMTYGSEPAHLDLSRADVALGNLQNYHPADPEFHEVLSAYEALRARGASDAPGGGAHHFAPAFTVFTADKDDPRFDANFRGGNVARYGFAAFCPRFPVYSALGFRTRDPHEVPAPNEHYSKLYVFHYDNGPKATHGPYVFGHNEALWEQVRRIDAFRQKLTLPADGGTFAWALAPDATGERQVVAWRWGDYLFAANFGSEAAAVHIAQASSGDSTAATGRGRALRDNEPIFLSPRGAWDATGATLAGDAVAIFYA